VIEEVLAASPVHHEEIPSAVVAVTLAAVSEIGRLEPSVIALATARSSGDLGVTVEAELGGHLSGAVVTLYALGQRVEVRVWARERPR
jgi:hypothetical protein